MNEVVDKTQKIAHLKNMLKRWVIIIVVVIVIAFIYYKAYSNAEAKFQAEIQKLSAEVEKLSNPIATYEQASKEVILGIIDTKMESMRELATMEYLYTNSGKYSNPKQLFGKDLPFTTKSFIAKWEGTIKAGINIEKITSDINENNNIITIYLPKAEIFSHEVHEESFETLDEKNGLFNKIEVDDIREFDYESKVAMEKRALENGILEKAEESAKAIIQGLLFMSPEIRELYTIQFKPVE
ncbi:DUF4230 domain-containing protein [Tissierella creatinini]|nr:DUF4230 domain-containing protein [Tissierella creatinini]TJX59295.1 DUF4230 domain-containing protein [Soehngenia saccharolytica]